jgi:hypothetical protein
VTIPSDLEGLTTIQVAPYVYEPSPRTNPARGVPAPLPDEAIVRLEAWLRTVSPLAASVPSAHLVHGYSSTWHITTEFRQWHGYQCSPTTA